jgi:hypothetical protein
LKLLQVVFGIAYLGLGIVQWVAEVDGLRHVLEWPTIFCVMLATFTARIPLLGTAAGSWGAHAAWGWDWLPALGLFLGFPVLMIIVVAVATAIDKYRERRA